MNRASFGRDWLQRAWREADGWRRGLLVVALLLGFLGLELALYPPIWRGEAGLGWDLTESYWPDLAFLAGQLARGDWPLWNPFERAGFPVHADPQPGHFYPVRWLFALWAAATGEASWALAQLFCLLHNAITGVTMVLFLRGRRLGWPAALLGGTAALVSGTWLGDQSNNYLFPMAWTPLVWLATDRLIERPSPRKAGWLAGALYLPASAGSPPGYFYTLLMVGLYGGFRLADTLVRLALRPPGQRLRALRALAGALGLALLLGAATQAILFAYTGQLTALSERAERTAAYVLDGYMGLAHSLIGIVAPANGTPLTYLGYVPLLLVLLGLVLAPGRDRGVPVLFVIASGFFLLLSFGSQLPLLGFLAEHVPGFDLFRVCARYRVAYGLMLAPAAAYGLDALLGARARAAAPGRARGLLAALAVLGAAVLAVWVSRSQPLFPAWVERGPGRAHGFLAAAATLLLALGLLPERLHAARGALVAGALLLTATDAPGFVFHPDRGLQPRLDNLEDRAVLTALPGRAGYRLYDEFVLGRRPGSRLGVRELRGYPSHDPLCSMDYRRLLLALHTAPQLLGELNVRYVLHGPHARKGMVAHHLRAPPDQLAPGRFVRRAPAVYEVVHPAPWVAWYGRVALVPRAEVLARLAGARDEHGRRDTAFVARELIDTERGARLRPALERLVEPATPAPVAVAGRVLHFEPDRLVAELVAPAEGLVVLNEADYPGWQVTVDGAAAEGVPVDHMLRGVLVRPGAHRIEWRYRPPGWWALCSLWLGGLAAVALACVTSLRRARRNTAPLLPVARRTLETIPLTGDR